jgi:hypothetical protein
VPDPGSSGTDKIQVCGGCRVEPASEAKPIGSQLLRGCNFGHSPIAITGGIST